MSNNLLLSPDSSRVSREELQYIPTPPATATWKPVPHYDIASLIVNEAEERGYCILSEEYGLNKSMTQLFGVLRCHPMGHPEFSRCLGLRNSHDKSLAVGLTAGVSVLVCENLCFGGETTIHRKHTSGICIEEMIPGAFDDLLSQYQKLEANIEILRERKISLNDARITVAKAAEIKAIPSCDVVPVLDEFKQPRHQEFAHYNRWNLYNAFTEIAKKYTPARVDRCYRKLGQLFNLI